MKKEYGKEDVTVCFTGGLSNLFKNESSLFGVVDVIDDNLTLEGIKLFWDMNNK